MKPFSKVNLSKQLKRLGIRVDREPGTGQIIAYVHKGEQVF